MSCIRGPDVPSIPRTSVLSIPRSTTTKINKEALDKVQCHELRLFTGATRSTPITKVERLTGVQSRGRRRDAKILKQADKFSCMSNRPVKTRPEGLTQNQLKISSFVRESKTLTRQLQGRLP